ncbi:hypothetical protein [Blastopirellula marina]|uniref:hypothetical protein n=1 Tax=Blastopirellula marina TaxID=124 RepID=UPI0011B076D9|nr:hypothetical protein [Blastopirellula marina]
MKPEELEEIDEHMKNVEQAWMLESPFPDPIKRLPDWPNVHLMMLNKHEQSDEDSLGHFWRVVMYYPLGDREVGELAIEIDDRQGAIDKQAVEKVRRVCALGLQTADRLEE